MAGVRVATRRRPPARSTWGTRARRCSTGSTRAMHGGTFVLRIEDTDRARTTDAAIVGMQDTLRWLGLDWDEGPVLQSDRSDLYRERRRRGCVAAGHAYECYCTADERAARSDAAVAAGGTARLRRPLPRPHGRGARRDGGRGSRERRAVPHARHGGRAGSTTWCGATSRSSGRLIRDFVIVRSDGTPIFFLANAVDDIDMEHHPRDPRRGPPRHDAPGARAPRGTRWRAATGLRTPAADRRRPIAPSSRSATVLIALEDFREQGYLPEALVELPRAVRVGTRRRTRDPLARRARRRVRPRPRHARGRGLRPQEARLAERRVDPPPRRSTSSSSASSPRPERGSVIVSTTRPSVSALALGQERATTHGAARRADGVPVRRRRRVRDRSRRRGRSSWRPTGSRGARRGHRARRARATGRIEAIDLRGPIEALGMKPRKVMPALYAAVEGRAAGAAALRLDLAARPRSRRSRGCGAARERFD